MYLSTLKMKLFEKKNYTLKENSKVPLLMTFPGIFIQKYHKEISETKQNCYPEIDWYVICKKMILIGDMTVMCDVPTKSVVLYSRAIFFHFISTISTKLSFT